MSYVYDANSYDYSDFQMHQHTNTIFFSSSSFKFLMVVPLNGFGDRAEKGYMIM